MVGLALVEEESNGGGLGLIMTRSGSCVDGQFAVQVGDLLVARAEELGFLGSGGVVWALRGAKGVVFRLKVQQ